MTHYHSGINPSRPYIFKRYRVFFTLNGADKGFVCRGRNMKQCATCGETKPEAEFYWRNKSQKKRWGTCKSCQKIQRQRWYQNNKETHKQRAMNQKRKRVWEARQLVWDYLTSHPCEVCGESDPAVLEFDHIRGNKKMNITDMASAGYSDGTILQEIGKCQVLCANCHRRKTKKERGWFVGQ